MFDEIRGSNVFLREDVRAMLVALGASARGMAAQSPHTERASVWLHGYESALAAVAVAMHIDMQSSTRSGMR